MPKKKAQPSPQTSFQGFQGPNYTQVPDQLFDDLLSELSGAELKALLYIIRRTFGFKKDSDNISINQMLKGITTKDGRVIDKGVGLTKKTLLSALTSLELKNIIVRIRRTSEQRGNEPTTYSLHVQREALGVKSTPPLGEKIPLGGGEQITPSPRGKKYATQETVIQDTVNNSPLDFTVRQQQDKAPEDVVTILKDYGIPGKISQELAETYPAEYIYEKIEYFVWLMENDKRRIERNPVGFLISAIKDDYKPDAAGDDQALGKAAEATGMLKQQRDYARIRSDLPTGST